MSKETGYPIVSPRKAVASVPVIDAVSYGHVGRYAGAVVLAVFESIGGLERMASWADANNNDFFTKLFPKVISRTQQVDVTGTLTIDDTISKLQALEADYTVMEPKREFDL